MANADMHLNRFEMLHHDAHHLLAIAKKFEGEGQKKLAAICARAALLTFVVSLEALVNRVLDAFADPPLGGVAGDVDRLPPVAKWALVPRLCGAPTNAPPFDLGKEPFQSFKELLAYRDNTVHPKPRGTVPLKITTVPGATVHPYEYEDSSVYPQTKIPKMPMLVGCEHAEKARDVVAEMIGWLKACLPEKFTEDWLLQITISLRVSDA